MNKLLVMVLLLFFSNMALADWKAGSDGMYLESASPKGSAAIVILKQGLIIAFAGMPQCQTSEEELTHPKEWKPVKINKQYIKTKMSCFNKELVISPSTDEGERFFQETIFDGENINITMPDTQKVLFINKGFREAIEEHEAMSTKAI